MFPVVHPFPLVVSQYFIRAQLNLSPSQNRTCAVNASGSQPSLVTKDYHCWRAIAIRSVSFAGDAKGKRSRYAWNWRQFFDFDCERRFSQRNASCFACRGTSSASANCH